MGAVGFYERGGNDFERDAEPAGFNFRYARLDTGSNDPGPDDRFRGLHPFSFREEG